MNSFICSQCHVLLISQLKMIHGTFRILVYQCYYLSKYCLSHQTWKQQKKIWFPAEKNLPKFILVLRNIQMMINCTWFYNYIDRVVYTELCFHWIITNELHFLSHYFSTFFHVVFFISLMFFPIFNSQNKSARFCW